MSERSNHLIERAAALLKDAHAREAERRSLPGGVNNVSQAGSAPSQAGIMSSSTTGGLHQPTKLPAVRDSVASLRNLASGQTVSVSALESAGMMVARLGRSRTSEEYRIVIGRLLRALHDSPSNDVSGSSNPPPNVVMVTSARPGEGKSFTSLNLGGSIAQNAGQSVLVIDVDAKRNSLTDLLGLAECKGFLDLVADPTLSPDNLIIPSDLPNLSILPLGTRSLAPGGSESDQVEERRLTPPILSIARRFPQTLMLLDAPPCLSTSDPHTLSPAVGQVVIVVEAERTQRSEVEAAVEMVKSCSNITMLLNKVKMNSSHTFGTYDYFGSYT